MIKEREEEILWDTITLLKEQNHYENALVLFKTLIQRTFSTLRLTTKFLDGVKIELPSDEFVNTIRILDKDIYLSLKRNDMTHAYESFVEYIEKLSEVISDANRKKFLAQVIAEQTESYVVSTIPRFDLDIPTSFEHADVYTSTEVAEIIGVSDQTVRRWCEKGKYPDAYKTKGNHWRIPKKYFRVNLDVARERKSFEQELNGFNKEHGEISEDEFI